MSIARRQDQDAYGKDVTLMIVHASSPEGREALADTLSKLGRKPLEDLLSIIRKVWEGTQSKIFHH